MRRKGRGLAMRLKEIVRTRNLKELERFCQGRTYQSVRDYAKSVGVDLDELEDLLGEI